MSKGSLISNYIPRISILAILGVLLSGCDGLVLFNPKGVIAEQQMYLFLTVAVIMTLVLLVVYIMTALFVFKYRASKKAEYDPSFVHSSKVEMFCWGIPIAIIFYFAYLTWHTSHSLDPFKSLKQEGEKELEVHVVALEWRWLFIYPEYGIATINELALPKDTPVKFMITSDAPMNSLWIPAIAGQIYAMSGMHSILHVKATEVGEYMGASANFSGEMYASMIFKTKVLTDDNFDKWVNEVKESGNTLSFDSYHNVSYKTGDNSVHKFVLTDSDLFYQIMDKYKKTNNLQYVVNGVEPKSESGYTHQHNH